MVNVLLDGSCCLEQVQLFDADFGLKDKRLSADIVVLFSVLYLGCHYLERSVPGT